MSILTYDPLDKFIIRCYKQLSDDPQERWANTWEIVATTGGTLGELQACANRILAFEQGMHGTHVYFKQYTISTWEPDSIPYNPENLFVQPMNVQGSRDMDNPMTLEACLMLKRGVTSGRDGRVYLRGALDEEDVQREGRYWTLTDAAGMASAMAAVVTASHIDYHYAGGIQALKIALVGSALGGGVTWARQITGLSIGGAVTNDLTHRWYNQPNRTLAAAARKAAREAAA